MSVYLWTLCLLAVTWVARGEDTADDNKEVDICLQPLHTQICRAAIPSWYFDAKEKACKEFIYGGCPAVNNRFPSREACIKRCKPDLSKMATGEDRQFDLVIFGASGFTGQYVVEELARTVDEEGGLKWAVAGRSVQKIQAVLDQCSRQTGKSLEDVPILAADVKNEESLQDMCRNTKLVLNCVGPYRNFGMPVVRACIENATNHIDISGEPGFLENVELLYSGKAKEKGIYIVGACGFDSIPCDLGILYTQNQFEGDLNHVEAFLDVKMGPEGGHGNYATWESAVQGYTHASELKQIRRSMGYKPIPKRNSKIPKRPVVFYAKDVSSWCIPFVGADRSVASRTQRYNYEINKERPAQVNVYMRESGLFSVFTKILMGIFFGICTKFKLGQWLLLTFPGLFSFGNFSTQGPTRKQIEGASFTITFVGMGHNSRIEDPDVAHEDKPDKKIVTQVAGPEIGYATTPICMVQAAYTILKEKDNLPPGGGVFTAGAAFGKTSLLQRLQNHNVAFAVIKK